VVGAVLLYLLPFVLSPLIGHHHALVFGLVMVLVVMYQPKGLMGLWDQAMQWGRRGAGAAQPVTAKGPTHG
jgi:branched-chain amino acid transport system permease protein